MNRPSSQPSGIPRRSSSADNVGNNNPLSQLRQSNGRSSSIGRPSTIGRASSIMGRPSTIQNVKYETSPQEMISSISNVNYEQLF
jgi:hypothetical protein